MKCWGLVVAGALLLSVCVSGAAQAQTNVELMAGPWDCEETLKQYAGFAGLELRVPAGELTDPATGERMKCAAKLKLHDVSPQEALAWLLYVSRVSATLSNSVLSIALAEGAPQVPETLQVRPEPADAATLMSDTARTKTVTVGSEAWDLPQMLEYLCFRADISDFVLSPGVHGNSVTVALHQTPLQEALHKALRESGCESLRWGHTLYVRKSTESVASSVESRPSTYGAMILAARKVQTYSYTEEYFGGSGSTSHWVKALGRSRKVSVGGIGGGAVEVRNERLGKHLFTGSGIAIVNSVPKERLFSAESPLVQDLYIYAFLARMRELGPSNVAGRATTGLQFVRPTQLGEECTVIWIDAATHLPIRIETISRSDDPTESSPREWRTVLTDFAFNIPVDDAMFSVTPPEGATVHESPKDQEPSPPPSEETFIRGLKRWAELCGNRFPDELKRQAMGEWHEVNDAAARTTGALFWQTLQFVRDLHVAKVPWHYAGKGVMLNTPDTPVFWYQPQGTNTYRVIYADLSARDVPVEPVPQGSL